MKFSAALVNIVAQSPYMQLKACLIKFAYTCYSVNVLMDLG